jgi:hypothetical protein
MTSLNASGFSITLLKSDREMLDAIDAPTTAVGWPRSIATATSDQIPANTINGSSNAPLPDLGGPKGEMGSKEVITYADLEQLIRSPSFRQ